MPTTPRPRLLTHAVLAFGAFALVGQLAVRTVIAADDHDHNHGFAEHFYDDDVKPARAGGGGGGRIVHAPDDITSFAPKESMAGIDASAINLHEVFMQLGAEAAAWYQHVLTLSDPFMEGRGPGTHGIEVAADYIEWNMRQAGLEAAFADENGNEQATFRQPFTFSYMGQPSAVSEAKVEVAGKALADGKDFVVFGNSGSDDVTGPVSFVGYAIEDGPNSYSSFGAEDDLTGRIALMLRYEPIGPDGKSRWDDERFSPHAALRGKLLACTDRGAKAIIIVNPPGAVNAAEGLETLESSSRIRPRMKVPVIQMSQEAADELLRNADANGRDLATLRSLADEGKIMVAHLGDDVAVHISTKVEQGRIKTENVAGVLKGKGDLADRWVVIGGHYDHLGYGYTGVRKRDQIGLVHPGADDNASGTAGVLMLAQRLSAEYAKSPEDASLRSVLFIAFSAEEAGLFGSKHFVDHPCMPLETVDLMLNFDMIGRLRDDQLSISGTGTAKEFDEILTPIFEASGLTINASRGGRGPSDHASFFAKGIPVLFPFTGLHDEYHTADDKGATVNPAGAIKVIDLAQAIAMEMVTRPGSLTFVRDTTPEAGAAPQRNAPTRLGIMPDYGADLDTGVRIDSVSDDSPAKRGGLHDGDTLLTWNGEAIDGARGLMEKLQSSKPGDKVTFKVLRDGKTVECTVTLEAQRSGN